jgi:hypothetical protein
MTHVSHIRSALSIGPPTYEPIIYIAQPAAQLWWEQPVAIGAVDEGLIFIALAFMIAATQHRYFNNAFEVTILPGLRVGLQVPWLIKIECFTRHRPPPAKKATIDRAKDAAILAGAAAGTVAVAVMRDPDAAIDTIAFRVIKGVTAIEEATRAQAKADAAAKAAFAAIAAQLAAAREEWVLSAQPFFLFTFAARLCRGLKNNGLLLGSMNK